MNEQGTQRGRWRSGATGAALAVMFGLLFLSHPFGHRLADLSYEIPFRLRSDLPVEGVRLIYMDSLSTTNLEQPWVDAPWERDLHARLLDRLRLSRARAVVFDIIMEHPGTNDQRLLEAIRAAEQAGVPVVTGGELKGDWKPGRLEGGNVARPFEALAEAAHWGLAEYGNPALARRRHFTGAEGLPTLAWLTAELTLSNPLTEVPDERWVNYYGPPLTLPHVSYYQALDPSLTPDSLFSGRICFVGARPTTTPFAGGVRSDEWTTPYGGRAPGVELTATVYLNLAHRQWLNRLSGPAEVLVVLLCGLAIGFGFARLRPTTTVVAGLAAALAVMAAGCVSMWQAHLWFSWMVVAAIQIPAGITWSILAYTRRIARDKTLLEQQLTAATRAHPATTATTANDATKLAPPPGAAGLPAIPDHALLRQVGRGAYGEVWLARNAIGTYHVVKLVRRTDFNHAEPYEREFHGLQKFMPISRSHPGLVQILQVGRRDADGFIYYVMEAADDESSGPVIQPESYVPKNLAREIRRRGHLPALECLELALNLTAALEFLHQHRLIHRDIKPANIIFVQDVPKFADIGLVTGIATDDHQVTYMGTEGYIAPEGPGTPAADVYSLGIVLYEASSGRAAREFPELPETLLQRPDSALLLQLNQILLKACRQDVSERYRSAGEMRAALLQLQSRITAPGQGKEGNPSP